MDINTLNEILKNKNQERKAYINETTNTKNEQRPS